MPGSGGLSPQEIEARDRAFKSKDLITKSMRFISDDLHSQNLTPLGTFVPNENYFLTALDVVSDTPTWGPAVISLSYSDHAVLTQAGSSGVTLFENWYTGTMTKFINLDPYGFYLENGRALNLFVISKTPGMQIYGSVTMYLIPTWTR